jgi:hypothetical protein
MFVALSFFFLTSTSLLNKWKADQSVLVGGNAIIFLVTLLSFVVTEKGIHHPNPNAFVRAVYGSFMIKFFLFIIAAFVYIFLYRKELNKPALFGCMGLFLVYTFMEVAALMKLLKEEKNG